MRFPRAALPVAALLAVLPAYAQSGADPLAWLQRAALSARETTYAGTVMHMQGERTATTRITHLFAEGSERERIESLDGPRREIMRLDDQMQCYFPDAKTVRLDRRVSARFFPSMVNGTPDEIARSYKVELGKVERVLGKDCQWIHLDPRDALRYAQRLCAEVESGLILRAKTLGAGHHVLEHYTFTDLRVGRDVSPREVKSTFRAQSKNWHRDEPPPGLSTAATEGWAVASPPPGFRRVGEMQRKLPNRPSPVTQIVLSDGLATISVFVEAATGAPRTAEATNEDGSLSVFVRPMGEHVVTVLGEVPPVAAQMVGRSVGVRAAALGGGAR